MSETQIWLDFAVSCNYISGEQYFPLIEQSEEAGRLIGNMIRNAGMFGAGG